jgi:anti-anti-sigma factor
MSVLNHPNLVAIDGGPADAPKLVEPEWVTRSGLLYMLVRNESGHWTLALDGELDRSNVAALEQEIVLAEAAGAASITIDLRGLEFTDLSGVRAIASAQRRARKGGRVWILEGPRAVQHAFELSGISAQVSR